MLCIKSANTIERTRFEGKSLKIYTKFFIIVSPVSVKGGKEGRGGRKNLKKEKNWCGKTRKSNNVFLFFLILNLFFFITTLLNQ